MATTPNFALRYYAGTDSPAGMTQQQNLALDVDARLTAGTDIRRVANSSAYPSSPVVGQYVDDAALGGLLRWNGTVWVPVTTDTQWQTITNISSSYTATVAQYRVKNNELRVRGSFTRTSGSVTVGETVFALPAGTYPTTTSLYRIPFQSSGTVSGFLALGTGGVATVAQVSGATTGITTATVPIPLD